MKKLLITLLVALFAFSCFASASKESTEAEVTPVQAALKAAENMTWDELLAKAKEEIGENEFNIYAVSTRMDVDTFTKKTGIKTKTTVLGTADLYTKYGTEAEAGVYGADVLVTLDAYEMGNLMEEGYVENYVPGAFKTILPAEEQEPLNIQYVNFVFFYNNDHGNLKNYVTNMWQFADPKYKGIIAQSPLLNSAVINNIIEMTKPEWDAKIKAAYKSYYGKDWKASDKFSTPAYEWFYGWIQNSVFEAKGGTIFNNTISGKPGTIGNVAFSKWRSGDIDTLTICPADGIEGVGGTLSKTFLVTAANAKYPYTAALFTYYLLTEEGYAAYYGGDPGGYSSNPNIAPSAAALARQDQPIEVWKKTCPGEDPVYVASKYNEVYTMISQWVAEKQ